MKLGLDFRADIEGLRAWAVLAVLAFHHGWGAVFGGGFVGVDVFFVISGYLITRMIVLQSSDDRFSFKEFYIRRIRRLFPALLFTAAVTLGFGMALSAPGDLEQLAESVLYAIFSLSNFYFWGQSGYFDAASIQKPLLHTWSLAVEEQFYLVWPFAVIFLRRFFRKASSALMILVGLVVVSTLWGEYAMKNHPSAVFYLTPFRMNEFALGAMCVWLPEGRRLPRAAREALALGGFGLIIFSILTFTEATKFPGLSSLVPCLGAAMLISIGGESGLTQRLLANRLMVAVGRISYSLYLVHWPVSVFYRQWVGDPTLLDAGIMTALSLVLAVISFRFIEQPFRLRGTSASAYSHRRFFRMFASLTACLAGGALLIGLNHGLEWRFAGDIVRFTREAEKEKAARFDPYRRRCLAKGAPSCDSPAEGVNVWILGDSHAPDAFNALESHYPDYHYVFKGLAGCPPLVREDYGLLTPRHPNREDCIARNEKLFYGNAELSRADLIVVNTVFQWYRPEHLAHSINRIRTFTDAPIVVLGNYLFFSEDFPGAVVRHGGMVMDDYYQKRLARQSLAFEEELTALSRSLGFTYISKRALFCSGRSALDCPIMFDGKLFTYDRHHLSLAAATAMGAAFKTRYGALFQLAP